MLEINELNKNYGDFSLGPLSLSVEAGCALGLVGANGAGKTTLFRSLMGTVRSDSGGCQLNGRETSYREASWKDQIGYVGDYTPFFDNWSGAKNLQTLAKFYSSWSESLAVELANRLRLNLSQKVKQYSTGNRTKLAIVAALCHQPALLVMDEPSNGLDPVARDTFMEILHEQLESGETTLLYATHHISEIEHLADRLVFLSEGQILRDELKEDLSQSWRRITFRSESMPTAIPHVVSQRGEHPYQELISDNGDATVAALKQQHVENIETSRLSIEKIAIEILKTSARELNHV
ncbi:MAG: ABC transporter ATP-binding protein [Gammaproteobacteria bacterium]